MTFLLFHCSRILIEADRNNTPTDSMFIEFIIFFKESILTSFSFNTKKIYSINAALLNEININDHLSTFTRIYAIYIIRRSEYINIRNMIIEKK